MSRANYDTDRDRITLPPDASPYQLAHERAHEHQARRADWLWRLDARCRRCPIVGAWIRLAVEIEAARLALTVLAMVGRCDRAARREARAGLLTYLRACFWS